jgi:hypothetical protein
MLVGVGMLVAIAPSNAQSSGGGVYIAPYDRGYSTYPSYYDTPSYQYAPSTSYYRYPSWNGGWNRGWHYHPPAYHQGYWHDGHYHPGHWHQGRWHYGRR